MKNSDSKITIILTNENNTSIKAQFRTFDILNTVKKKIYSLFFPLPNDVILKYGNINISKCLDVKLGHLFPNKKQIKLNIITNKKQTTTALNPIKKLVKNNSAAFISGNSERKPYAYKYIKLKLPPIQKNMAHNLSLNNIKKKISNNNNKSEDKNSSFIMPKIKLKTISNNRDIKRNLFGAKKIHLKNFDINIINNSCVECFYMDIQIYCRHCNKFICKNCFDKSHSTKNHLNIEVDDNNYKTFSKYKKELNDNLDKSSQSINYLENINQDKINIDIWNKKYKEGIDKLVEASYDISNNSKNEERNDYNNNNIELDLNFIKREYIYINDIDCRENRDPFETFCELNNKEKEIYKIINEYKNNVDQNKKISNKIGGLFTEVETEIDKIMFELELQVYESKKNILMNNK